jgi:hypothetical protein
MDGFDIGDFDISGDFATLGIESSNEDNLELFQFEKVESKEIKSENREKPLSDFRQSRKFKINLYQEHNVYVKFVNSKSKVDFDNHTLEYYKSMREQHYCPLSSKKVDPEKCFKLYDMWDPYTGDRIGPDPYGPLCFDIDTLVKHIYNNRLRKLWVEQSDENDGIYEGYYDDAVGAGNDFLVVGRGHHPEWDIFRIPIMDCYLMSDHNTQIITFGPKLTDEELAQIDYIASNKLGNSYERQFRQYRPSLLKIKQFYDVAISKEPQIQIHEDMTEAEKQYAYNITNREAVNQLKKIRG